MMKTEDLLQYIDLILRFFAPLLRAAENTEQAEALLLDLGYVPPSQVLAFNGFSGVVGEVIDLISNLDQAVEDENTEGVVPVLIEMLEKIRLIFQGVNDLKSRIQDNFPGSDFITQTDILAVISRKLTDYLVIRFLEVNHTKLHAALLLAGIIEIEDIAETPSAFHIPYRKRTMNWDNILTFFSDPIDTFKANYTGGNEFLYNRFIFLLNKLGVALGLPTTFDVPDNAVLTTFNHGSDLTVRDDYDRLIILRFPLVTDPEATLALEVYPMLNPATGKYTGLGIGLRFGGELEIPFNDTHRVVIKLSASLSDSFGFSVDREGNFTFINKIFTPNPEELAASVQFGMNISIVPTEEAPPDKLLVISALQGSRFEIGSGTLTLGLERLDSLRLFIESDLKDGLVQLAANEADGFISSILPEDGIEATFNFGIGISNSSGLYFKGASGLHTRTPLHLSLGPIEIQYLDLKAGFENNSLLVTVTSGFSALLGPLSVMVEEIGTQATFKVVTDRTGNLGPLDAKFDFKPPMGLGLSVDTAAITGGGSLTFYPDKGQYSGEIHLKLHDIAVNAFGILDTRLPGGASGFSFLILIFMEFEPPIQLGFGFALKGVGGLIGINRTMIQGELEERLRNKSLDHILFPQDVQRNAPQIISDLRAIFPPAEGQFVIGPMVKIIWPVSEPLLQAELGLVLEIPNRPWALLGHVEALVPADKQIVQLRLDILGELDFSKKRLQIQTTIYDSNIAGFPLAGDAALLVAWGDQPEFIFSIGGFHPHFHPPAGFPPLKRLTVCLDNDDVRLTIQMYLAITPNTFQIGASAELVAGGKYNVHGWLSFDALIEFNPFRFRTDISAGVELRRNTRVIAGVRLKGTLEGPNPYHVHGKASISFLFFSVSVSFDRTFGESVTIIPPTFDLKQQLKDAVKDPHNWSATLPPSVQHVVTAAAPKLNAPAVLVDPMGAVELHERLVPLNLQIQKFAEVKLAEPVKFSVTKVMIGETTVDKDRYSSVKDFFAPGQFLYLTEDQKFSRPSFEKLDAGVAFGSDAVTSDKKGVEAEVKYETIIVDSPFEPGRPGDNYKLSGAHLLALSELGASTLGGFNTTGARKFAPDPRSPAFVGLVDEGYLVVSADNLSRTNITLSPMTKTEAQVALDVYLVDHPQERGRLQVVPSHEI